LAIANDNDDDVDDDNESEMSLPVVLIADYPRRALLDHHASIESTFDNAKRVLLSVDATQH